MKETIATTNLYCDICKKQINTDNQEKFNHELTVIFTTEQTEGYSVKPYLRTQKLDICPECMNKILEGNMVFAKGAQGINEYYFLQD